MKDKIERIKNLMAELNINQSKLAELSGLSFSTINRILNFKQDLKPNTLEKLLIPLGVSLVDFENEEKPLGQLHGYINFCNEITEIKSYKALKKWFEKCQYINETLPKEAKLILREEKTIASKVKSVDIDKDSIDFYRQEVYDATTLDTLPFRRGIDTIEEKSIDFGNMGISFPFSYNGRSYNSSEALYICGMFSDNNNKHIEIQNKLTSSKNGYDAKKVVRGKYEEDFARHDWESFNVEWMKWVIWTKVNGNNDFKRLLLSVPKNTHIIENSTFQKGTTSYFWGAKNKELEDKRNIIEEKVNYENYALPTKILEAKKIEARNSIRHFGKWEGCNCMGKILKYIQLCLLDNVEPKIDYELLRSKEIYLFGELLTFEKPQQIAIMFDMDMTLVDSSISKGLQWKEAQKMIPQHKLYDGVIELITKLNDKGVSTWVVSGNVESTIKKTIQYFNIPIDLSHISGYRYGMTTDNLKRKIAVIKNALKEIDSDNIYYIGDEADDVEACRQLGIKCILATWGSYISSSDIKCQTASKPSEVFNLVI